jgi:hypothetical protein
MEEAISPTKDLLDVLIQVLIVVLPVVITWFIRTYVRGSAAERNIAAIVRLSNSAINLVENLDKRGALDLPTDISKGAYKLRLAGSWLESELKRAGIKINDEEARHWIASEFQKRVGDVRMVGTIAELAQQAVNLVQSLDQRGVVEIPPEVERAVHLTELAADWLITQIAKQGATISREEALTWVRAEFLQQLGGQVSNGSSVSDALTDLAERAVAFLEKLKSSGQLVLQPDTAPEQFETDVAAAWAMTEAAKQGLTVTKTQITEAVAAALRQHDVGSA